MALKREQDELLTYIDTILTLTEQMPNFDIESLSGGNLGASLTLNPIDYLIQIIEKFVTKQQLTNFLIKILTESLPYIELATKTAILSNIKKSVDCLNDPRIPSWMRQPIPGTITPPSLSVGTPTSAKIWDLDIFHENRCGGILFNIFDMDYNQIFRINPLNLLGKAHYFGCNSFYKINVTRDMLTQYSKLLETKDGETIDDSINRIANKKYLTKALAIDDCNKYGIPLYTLVGGTKYIAKKETIERFSEVDSVYELIRARDMNAFLWLVINKHEYTQWLNWQNMKEGFSVEIDDGEGGTATVKKEWYNFNDEKIKVDNDSIILQHFEGRLKAYPQSAMWPIDVGVPVMNESGNAISLTKSLCFKKRVTKIPSKSDEVYAIDNFPSYMLKDTGKLLQDQLVTASTRNNYDYEIVPFTNSEGSYNWYINNGQFWEFLKPVNKRNKKRDYNKDRAICNFRFIQDISKLNSSYYDLHFQGQTQGNSVVSDYSNKFKLDEAKIRGGKNNYMLFSILPKPLVHFDVLNPLTAKPITYDSYGKKKLLSRYSVLVEYETFENRTTATTQNANGQEQTTTLMGLYHGFSPKRYVGKLNKLGKYDKVDEVTKVFYKVLLNNGDEFKTKEGYNVLICGDDGLPYCGTISGNKVDIKKDKKSIIDDDVWINNFWKFSYECYPHLTVYEFNYDYVFGMELFDPVTITSHLLEAAYKIGGDSGIDLSASLSRTETEYQMRIAEIIKNILNEDTSEVNDCFYTFSNEKYDKMLNESEMKRANAYPFQDANNHLSKVDSSEVMSILSEYDNEGTLEDNQEILNRAITTATANITREILPEDRYSFEKNLVIDLIKSLVSTLIEAVLSPKILILLELNRQLMGKDFTELPSFEDLLKSLIGLIIAIIREIRDMIIKLLLDWALEILTELLSDLALHLIKEQLEYYTRLIRALIKACSFRFPRRTDLPSVLDNVDYADIDEAEAPQIDPC